MLETIYTVSDLNSDVRWRLESIGMVMVKGEISGFVKASSGHRYFSLKDEKAEVRCALFQGSARRIDSKAIEMMKNGIEVVVTARVTLYESRGSYQLVIENVHIKNLEGELYIKKQEIEKKLRKEGLFDLEIKKPLPKHPKVVGIVTSPDGAALQDIIRAFKRRNPTIRLLIYPVLVQGDKAPGQIVKAINLANQRSDTDILILARGGGSIEDLWAFNEEIVARAIHKSLLPIVTGIGHETDTTTADYVADERLATPTAAAERVSTPSRDDTLGQFNLLEAKLTELISRKLNDLGQQIDFARQGLIHPKQRIELLHKQFEHLDERLNNIIKTRIADFDNHVRLSYQRLLGLSPIRLINLNQQKLTSMQNELSSRMQLSLQHQTHHLTALSDQLESVNPNAVIERGYSIIRRSDNNEVVSSAANITVGENLTAQLADGRLNVDVKSIDQKAKIKT